LKELGAVTELTEPLSNLIEEFAKLPGIGKKSAERLAYHILRVHPSEALALAEAIRNVKENVRHCRICFNLAQQEECAICRDPKRDRGLLCVVEQPRDLMALEQTGAYRGLYHVLGGRIAPLERVYPEDLTIDGLLRRAQENEVKEVIIATNPDTEGDSTANFLMDKLAPLDVAVSVLARGVPAGGQIEHAAQSTLAGAISGRRGVSAKDK